MLAEISPDSCIYYMLHEGASDARRFCSFVSQVADETGESVRFVVDRFRIHTAQEMAHFLDREFENGQVRIHIFPEYSPKLKPNVLEYSHVKRMMSQKLFKIKDDMLRLIEAEFKSRRDLTDIVASFFMEPDCQYNLA